MKKVLLGVCATSLFYAADAQDCGTRYRDFIFDTAPDKVEVTYSTSNQKMDIYTPAGDAETNRAVIVWAHGGSFVGGSKADADVAKLAENFAKRGYVTASIDYSLTSVLNLIDSSTAYEPVMVTVGEAKAAVRYLRANAATYGIGPDNIYFGGNSAGAVLGLNYAFMDDMSKATPLLTTAINAHGGLEGDFGNPGFSSKFKAMISLAGGVLYTDWIDGQSNIPTLMCQGDADGTVPYNCGAVLGGNSTIPLCGSNAMEPNLAAAGITHAKHVWIGGGHCPWSDGNPNNAELAKVDTIVRDFLYPYAACGQGVGIKTVENNKLLSVYPNPAQNVINIAVENAAAEIKSVRLYNILGQTAYNGNETKISTTTLQNGMYFVEVLFKDNQRAVKRVEVLK